MPKVPSISILKINMTFETSWLLIKQVSFLYGTRGFEKTKLTEFEDQLNFIIDYILDILEQNHSLLLFISKNLAWGVFQGLLKKKCRMKIIISMNPMDSFWQKADAHTKIRNLCCSPLLSWWVLPATVVFYTSSRFPWPNTDLICTGQPTQFSSASQMTRAHHSDRIQKEYNLSCTLFSFHADCLRPSYIFPSFRAS